jgi:Leucine-rich repeat (LRR) protein
MKPNWWIATSFVLVLLSAKAYSNTCPFSEDCNTYYDKASGSCTVYCYYKNKFPIRGDSTTTSISRIDLTGSFDSIPDGAFKNLNIFSLSLESDKLVTIRSKMFSDTAIAKYVSLKLPALNNIEIGSFANFKNVTEFHMQRSSLTDDTLFNSNLYKEINSITDLVELNLDNNMLKKFPYYLVDGMRNLKKISLKENLIESFTAPSGNYFVETIDLSSNSLQYINSSLANLKGLGRLLLAQNPLKFICDNCLVNFNYLDISKTGISENFRLVAPDLKVLSATNNNLKVINAAFLESMPKLETIWLDDNLIESVSLRKLNANTLTSLSMLSLKRNKITTIANTDLIEVQSLKELYLSSNQIKEVKWQNLNLVTLELNANQIQSISLKNLPNLKNLYIGINNLIGQLPSSSIDLGDLPSLSVLHLNTNGITAVDFTTLNFKQLSVLHLGTNKINSAKLDSLSNLQELSLSNNQLEDFPSVSNKQNIKNLDLSSNKLRSANQLNDYVNLYQLDLSSNYLEKLPNYEKLTRLEYFYFINQNGLFTKVPNYAFQRLNPLSEKITIDYKGNNIGEYESKAFCVDSEDKKISNGQVEISLNSIDKIHPCMLEQLKSYNQVKIKLNTITAAAECDCQLVRWAKEKYKVVIEGYFCSQDCDYNAPLVDKYQCQTKTEYKCDTEPTNLRNRQTTWITGDPHIYSYNNNYQVCSFNEQEVACLKFDWLTIYCTDKKIAPDATVLSKLRIEFVLDGVTYSYLADDALFGDSFANGVKNITDSKNQVFIYLYFYTFIVFFCLRASLLILLFENK